MGHTGVQEIEVASWEQLNVVFREHGLIQRHDGEGRHLRAPYVFRGLDRADWRLATSFERLNPQGPPQIVERASLRAFRRYANAGAFDDKSDW